MLQNHHKMVSGANVWHLSNYLIIKRIITIHKLEVLFWSISCLLQFFFLLGKAVVKFCLSEFLLIQTQCALMCGNALKASSFFLLNSACVSFFILGFKWTLSDKTVSVSYQSKCSHGDLDNICLVQEVSHFLLWSEGGLDVNAAHEAAEWKVQLCISFTSVMIWSVAFQPLALTRYEHILNLFISQ